MTTAFTQAGRSLIDRPYLLLSLTNLFWAGNIVFGRFVAGHVPPVGLTVIRWGGAFLLLLPVAWPYLKRDWPLIRRHWIVLTVLAVTGNAGYNAMSYWGLQYTEAINALLIQSMGPPLVAIWALVLFGDRLSLSQAVGILISMTGAMIVISRASLEALLAIRFNQGDIWFFCALIVFAFYSTLAKRRPMLHPLSFLTVTAGWSAFLLIPVWIWEMSNGHIPKLDAITITTFAYVIVFPSIVSYLCFNRGVELIGPNRAAPFFHLMPVFGAILAILFLGERPQLYHAVAFALVLCGVAIATRKPYTSVV